MFPIRFFPNLLQAIQRLGLCRAGFSPPPQSRRPQSAKTLFWQGLSDSLAMSSLAHYARPHRSPKPDRSCLTSHFRPAYRLPAPRLPARAVKDFVFFAAAQTAVLRCKTRRLLPCRWRFDAASDVAAASRGFSRPHRSPHRNSSRIRALFKSACVKHRFIVRLAARSQGSTGRGFRSSLSVLAPPTA
jgi:hypothetical protein